MTPETRNKYKEAVTLDIVALLDKETPGIFEFRRIAEIASMVVQLFGATDAREESEAVNNILRIVEFKAPNLHDALMARVFDGKNTLRQKYEQLVGQERQLKQAKLNIESARDGLKHEEARLAAHETLLKLHEKHLEREQERLQLTADTAGVKVDLLALPRLTNPDEEAVVENNNGESGSKQQPSPDSLEGRSIFGSY